jgi:hypothetical protein
MNSKDFLKFPDIYELFVFFLYLEKQIWYNMNCAKAQAGHQFSGENW